MKSLAAKISLYVLDFIWVIMESIVVEAVKYVERKRARLKAGVDMQEALKLISPDLAVKNGPFKGMIYPKRAAVGSQLVPKFLGSYEQELHPIVEKICANEYSEIVNIGCAEGYYTVGLAMRIQTAAIFAYDTNQTAIDLCKQMAQINHVAERLVTGSFCDANTLRAIPFSGKALIVCDSEGYEKDLFTEEVVSFLARHDLLIEIHDCFDIEISSILRRRFQNTHLITTIQSVDDVMKATSYRYAELQNYSLAARKVLLAEYRDAIQEWFYLTPRTN
jgi:hypothetical protein